LRYKNINSERKVKLSANLNIKTVQYDECGQKDTITLNTTATIYEKSNAIYVVYKEEETTTTIKILKDEVNIKKFGMTNSNMRFKEGVCEVIRYATPQGVFLIENDTKKLKINIDNSNIKIDIDYNIKIENLFNGRNEISINITL
jgi:uncharacterized beta-barrel protein YwiB (DUF1934 family)